MKEEFSRLQLLLGEKAIKTLSMKRVAVFGVGGVGGYVVEALARSAIGALDVIDADSFSPSNLNRQLLATTSTLGLSKVDVAENRIHSINPDCVVKKHNHFYLPDDPGDINFADYDYIVDAIDTVSAKIDIIMKAKELDIPIISSMGCGNRIDPTKLKVADIFETSMDPLSKVMRRELRKRGVKSLDVVYSEEEILSPLRKKPNAGEKRKKDVPGSSAFVPSVAGLIIASVVIKNLSNYEESRKEAFAYLGEEE